MTRVRTSRWIVQGAVASALSAGALAACSLGLKSEDSYFAALDGGSVANPSKSPDASSSPKDASVGAVDSGGGSQPPGDDDAGSDAGSDLEAAAPGDGGTGSETSAPFDAAALEPALLQVYYSFDQDGGSPGVVLDQSGNHLDGLLLGGVDGGSAPPAIDPLGHKGHGLKLDGAQLQYVQLPSRVLQGFDAASVSCWINIAQPQVWDRLFDFNNGSSVWMYFSPTGWNKLATPPGPGTHFAISDGFLDPEMYMTETVSPGTWHHIVVVLDRPYFFYYEDGVQKAFMDDMTLTPNDVNAVYNWLGRSAYPTDPYIDATIDEFRLYSGGLRPDEVQQLFSE
jgi:hypothetical protein